VQSLKNGFVQNPVVTVEELKQQAVNYAINWKKRRLKMKLTDYYCWQSCQAKTQLRL
jgi:hypothetical protein